MRHHEFDNLDPKSIGNLAPAILKAADVGIFTSADDILADAKSRRTRWSDAAATHFLKSKKKGYKDGFEEGLQKALVGFVEVKTARDNVLTQVTEQVECLVSDVLKRFFGVVPRPQLLALATQQALHQLDALATPRLITNSRTKDELEPRFADLDIPFPLEVDDQCPDDEVCLVSENGRVHISLEDHLKTVEDALGLISKEHTDG